MRIQFEIMADTVETRTRMGVDLPSNEIEDFGEELGRVIERYFLEEPFATYDVNQVSLINVEVNGSEFKVLHFKD